MDPSDRNCGNYDWRHIWSHLGSLLRNAFIEVVLKKEEARIEKNLKMAKGHTDDDVAYDEEGRASLNEDDKNNNIHKPLRICLIFKGFSYQNIYIN